MADEENSPVIPLGIWEWYPHSILRDDPPPQQLIKGVAPFNHGTYQSLPYYAVIESKADGKKYLVSDCGLRAELVVIPESVKSNANGDDQAEFKLVVAGENAAQFKDAVLSYNLESCEEDKDFYFVVTGTTDDCVLLPSGTHPHGHYIPSIHRVSNMDSNPVEFGSVFVNKAFSFRLLQRSWDVRKMDLANCDFQSEGSGAELFKLPDGKTFDYRQAGDHVTVPYGWVYESKAGGEGKASSSMFSSSADVMNSVQQAAGFNVRGELGVKMGDTEKGAGLEVMGKFSVANNQKLSDKLGKMYKKEQTFMEKTCVQTEGVYVLDKRNAKLSEKFSSAVRELRTLVAKAPGGRLDDVTLERFLNIWGTHYAYAATFGARGIQVTTISKETVKQLVVKQVDVKAAWSAGLKVVVGPVRGEIEGGQDTEENKEHEKQLEKFLEKEQTTTRTYGGSSSSGGEPGAGFRIPIYLDLRPLSDLLGVPFFTDEATAITLRDQVAAAVPKYAFKEPSEVDTQETVGFRQIEFGTLQIDVATPDYSNPDSYERAMTPSGQSYIRWSYAEPYRLLDPRSWGVSLIFPPDTVVNTETKAVPSASGRGVVEDQEGRQQIDLWSLGGTSTILSQRPESGPLKIGINVQLGIPREADRLEILNPGMHFDATDPQTFVTLDLTQPGKAVLGPVVLHNVGSSGAEKGALRYPVTLKWEVSVQVASVKALLGLPM